MNFKYILSFATFVTLTVTSYSQVYYNYNELGTLFSKDDNKGTARFNAMSGAFGALGGDISSITINPAGAAISKLSAISITGTHSKLEYAANYYGETNNNQTTNFKIPQIGGMLVFSNGKNSNWNRTALYFNYRNKTNFSHSYKIVGNSEQLYYTNHLADTGVNLFDGSVEQYISNDISGKSDVFNIGFSTVHNNKLFLGAALKFHQFDFSQKSIFNEVNDDINGEILDTEEYTETYISGNGFSFNLGFIYKFNKNFRLGLSYETPTFYSDVLEDYYDELTMFENTNLGIAKHFESSGDQSFLYRFQSPSRITASGALIFGKQGLISIDYTVKNYKSIEFSGGDFTEINSNFVDNYEKSHLLNIGTEWRFDNLSLRGGISYENDANLTLTDLYEKNNMMGYSLGLGYSFGKTKFDLSFNSSDNINYYSVYNTGDLSIDKNLTQISGTFTFNL